MREWTDVDYAQAAIDMLPETVEEIVEFLRAQGEPSKWTDHGCPIGRWLRRWVDGRANSGYSTYRVGTSNHNMPAHVQEYVRYVDGVKIHRS